MTELQQYEPGIGVVHNVVYYYERLWLLQKLNKLYFTCSVISKLCKNELFASLVNL